MEHFGGPNEVFQAEARDYAAVEGMSPKMAERILKLASDPVDDVIDALLKVDAGVVSYQDPDYPANLRQIYDPPVVLFVRGRLSDDDRFAIGVVGTRRPSEYGKSMAFKMGRELAGHGLCVVSGGARGIDTAAHTGALQAGRTIAVLGSGVDVPYPYENRGLLDKIAENGAVMSEFVPGTKPDSWRFPVRNRLISGLVLGLLVVESQVAGGAMITATLAAEQGRDVWALPGATDSANSQGPHSLIKDGAKLVERAEDILADLNIPVAESERKPVPVPADLTSEQTAIIKTLTLHPKPVDDIIAECGIPAALASSSLTLLEMKGLVRRVPGNAYVRSV